MFILTTMDGLNALCSAAATRDEMIVLALTSRLGFKDLDEFRQNAAVKGRDAVERMIANAGGTPLPDERILISDDVDDPDLFSLSWILNRIDGGLTATPPYYFETLRFHAAFKVDNAWSQANDVPVEIPDSTTDDGEGTPTRQKKWSEWGDPAAHAFSGAGDAFRWIELTTRRELLAGSLLKLIDAIDPTDITSTVRPIANWPAE